MSGRMSTPPPGSPAVEPPFTVLCVCTGNICRSPLVERLFVAGLVARLGSSPPDLVVHSAGTWGL